MVGWITFIAWGSHWPHEKRPSLFNKVSYTNEHFPYLSAWQLWLTHIYIRVLRKPKPRDEKMYETHTVYHMFEYVVIPHWTNTEQSYMVRPSWRLSFVVLLQEVGSTRQTQQAACSEITLSIRPIVLIDSGSFVYVYRGLPVFVCVLSKQLFKSCCYYHIHIKHFPSNLYSYQTAGYG